MSDETIGESSGLDRRNAIKRGIAAGAAAGVVWSAPKIEGLSLRPSYAAAQSGGAAPFSAQTVFVPGFPPFGYTQTLSPANIVSLPSKISSGGATVSGGPGWAGFTIFFNNVGTATINALTGPAGDTTNWVLGSLRADPAASVGAGTSLHQRRYNFTTNTPDVAPIIVMSCT